MSLPRPTVPDQAASRRRPRPAHPRQRDVRRDGPPGARLRLAVGRLLRSATGVSAVEFAILAPLLVLGAFGTADAGRAIYQRMMIGQSLRAAAQLAMAGADEDAVRSVFQEVASENFTIAPEGTDASNADGDTLAIAVQSYCACPSQSFVQIGCTTVCSTGIAATRFYRLFAGKSFDGIMLPDFPISGAIDVMVE